MFQPKKPTKTVKKGWVGPPKVKQNVGKNMAKILHYLDKYYALLSSNGDIWQSNARYCQVMPLFIKYHVFLKILRYLA